MKTMQGRLNHTVPWSLVVKGIVHLKMTSPSLFTQTYVLFSGLSSSNMTAKQYKGDPHSLDLLFCCCCCCNRTGSEVVERGGWDWEGPQVGTQTRVTRNATELATRLTAPTIA